MKRQAATRQGKRRQRQRPPSAARRDELIQQATVDAYDESEQAIGFHSMLDEHLATPFKTEVLGVEVTVERIDLTDDDQIVAVCAHAKSRQRIPILDLPVPHPPPGGSEWIEAYRRWARGGDR